MLTFALQDTPGDEGSGMHRVKRYLLIATGVPAPGQTQEQIYQAAMAAVRSQAPSTLMGNSNQSLCQNWPVLTEIPGTFNYRVEVPYDIRVWTPFPTSAVTYGWETTGGTMHRDWAYELIATHWATDEASGSLPDPGPMIGLQDDGSVTGVDIPDAKDDWTETHWLPLTTVTDAYKALLTTLSGRAVNNGTFKGHDKGSTLFLGVTGTMRRSADAPLDWELTFHFSSRATETIQLPGFPSFTKEGWQYLWIRRAWRSVTCSDSKKRLVYKAIAAYVDRVFPYYDLGSLQIGS